MSTSHAMSGFTKVLIGLVGLFLVIALLVFGGRWLWRWITEDKVVEVEQSEVTEQVSQTTVEKRIHIHESAEAFGVRVTPFNFLDDRCPLDSGCSESGAVLAHVNINGVGGKSTEHLALGDTTMRDSVAVTFAEVTPLPIPGRLNELTDYEFTFVFEQQ